MILLSDAGITREYITSISLEQVHISPFQNLVSMSLARVRLSGWFSLLVRASLKISSDTSKTSEVTAVMLRSRLLRCIPVSRLALLGKRQSSAGLGLRKSL